MKNAISRILLLVMLLVVLEGCSNKSAPSNSDSADESNISVSTEKEGEVVESFDPALEPQLFAPSEESVIDRLNTVSYITELEAVTKDHDPNGLLSKSDGYLSCIYFSTNLFDPLSASGDTIVDRGVSGGGAVEVFRTVEDAESRDQYLAQFDGSSLGAGSHHVLGTIVIRTSDNLVSIDQTMLTRAISIALRKTDDEIKTEKTEIVEPTIEDSSITESSTGEVSEELRAEDSSSPNEDSSEDNDSMSAEQKNAVESAKSYIRHSAFSREGLIEQLKYEGFSEEAAIYGVDNCEANWLGEAVEQAQSYVSHSSFSYLGLIDQMKYSGFTDEEAEYGADNCGANWREEALEQAESYIKHSAFSYQGLIDQLLYSEYPEEDAVYAADNCGANWEEQAVKKAESYLSHSSFSRDQLIDQLEYEGFTHEQAVYGAEHNGL